MTEGSLNPGKSRQEDGQGSAQSGRAKPGPDRGKACRQASGSCRAGLPSSVMLGCGVQARCDAKAHPAHRLDIIVHHCALGPGEDTAPSAGIAPLELCLAPLVLGVCRTDAGWGQAPGVGCGA